MTSWRDKLRLFFAHGNDCGGGAGAATAVQSETYAMDGGICLRLVLHLVIGVFLYHHKFKYMHMWVW